jgi:hypothetical protein
MTAVVAITNLILGVAYTGYGVITAVEMKRGWKTYGFSHFGAAWIAMAFTCGPHHLAHGLHTAFEGRIGGPLDAFSVVVGLPFGVIWLLLRIEAMRGGRGDRFISGTPRWMLAAPTIAGIYVTALVAAIIAGVGGPLHFVPTQPANALLIVLYVTIGYFLLRTQLRNHSSLDGWSVSGCSLSVVFPTCALMHAVFAIYSATGRYAYDVHAMYIDWLAVPAAAYFLWVVRELYRDSLRDWNQVMGSQAYATVSS